MSKEEKICFVIMPISEIDIYQSGHFKRVYEYIIKPACAKAGFTAIRADDIKQTNVIVIDILQKLISAEMAICDLSSHNPNVLYELGIRQAFDLPVSFIKDDITERIFDIQGFRDTEYSHTLRIDEVNTAIAEISQSLTETSERKAEDINSIIQLLGISKAKINTKIEISAETNLILKSFEDISSRLGTIEDQLKPIRPQLPPVTLSVNKNRKSVQSTEFNGQLYAVNDLFKHERFGTGRVLEMFEDTISGPIAVIHFDEIGTKQLMIKFAKLDRVK